ncbi:uncharacterized protein Dwil_GK14789 [Drosophila willistoni]|uniref:E3 ubiquitin-protein ligase APD1-4 middle domain-containing protein n=1 Tax=Drosophila willistoni TaxID=7260 RepID=B4MUK2_DROWI|nr:uncharacterized protein LOC6642739 [Drosophila willistoni]EDW76197.2 uncharacterized protein Dwil_GK14789 [Drosophila willistoni]
MQQITEYHFEETRKMHGVKRVLIFCLMIVIIPATLIIMPLYLRRTVFADVVYPVAESDIIEIRAGISSIFCSKHTLKMDSHFNAFQLRNKPEISTNRKHIRLKKSMTLPDDTLEYWGFFLLAGASVKFKFCSRYDGSRIMVVKGDRELQLCGLTDHNKNKFGANYAQGHEQVRVFFEDVVELQSENAPNEGVLEQENNAGEDLSDDHIAATNATTLDNTTLTSMSSTNGKHPKKKLKKGTPHHSENSVGGNVTASEPLETRTRRHHGQHLSHSEHAQKKRELYDQLYKRPKRENVYDRKYSHGGNAMNFTETDESNSVSSFENGLIACFRHGLLLAKFFNSSSACTSAHYLENATHGVANGTHDITQAGYYYYIFYSDNDLVRNDIHAIFDIYKPTFQYSNLSESQSCLNTTECSFNISFLSDEIVVVEVPTRDGIEHEADDITNLISTCHPRSEIYAIFPITVLVLILCCSFL